MRKFCTRYRAYHSRSRKTPAERIFRPVPCTGDIRSYTDVSQPPDCVSARGRYRTYSPEVTRSEPAISRINAILHAERHTLSQRARIKYHTDPALSSRNFTEKRRKRKGFSVVFPPVRQGPRRRFSPRTTYIYCIGSVAQHLPSPPKRKAAGFPRKPAAVFCVPADRRPVTAAGSAGEISLPETEGSVRRAETASGRRT